MEKKEYKELKSLITNGFSRATKDYQEFATFVAMHFSSLEDRVKWLEENVAIKENVATEEDINKILKILDDQSKHLDEQSMLIGQVDRHEKWIHKIAGDTGIQLEY